MVKSTYGNEAILERAAGSFTFEIAVKADKQQGLQSPKKTATPALKIWTEMKLQMRKTTVMQSGKRSAKRWWALHVMSVFTDLRWFPTA